MTSNATFHVIIIKGNTKRPFSTRILHLSFHIARTSNSSSFSLFVFIFFHPSPDMIDPVLVIVVFGNLVKKLYLTPTIEGVELWSCGNRCGNNARKACEAGARWLRIEWVEPSIKVELHVLEQAMENMSIRNNSAVICQQTVNHFNAFICLLGLLGRFTRPFVFCEAF